MPFDSRDANRGRGAPRMKLVAGNSNRPLAEEISSILKNPLAKSVVKRFADMEVFVEIQENMRGEDVYRPAVDVVSRQRQSDGAADHGRRAEAVDRRAASRR